MSRSFRRALVFTSVAVVAASLGAVVVRSQTRTRLQIRTLDQAKSRVVTQVLGGNVGRRALFGHPQLRPKGTRISSWREPGKLIVNEESYFFFVDEMPGANWEHPAKYVLVNARTGGIQQVNASTPPDDVAQLSGLNPVAVQEVQVMRQNVRQLRLQTLVRKPILRLGVQKRYAVLLSGGWNASSNYSRYWNDLSFIYKALKEKYGFKDEDIVVLYANGSHSPNEDLDGNGTDDLDYAATKANLTAVFNDIGSKIPADGKFFFYSTNHGGQVSGHNAVLYLWGETITDGEFATLSKKIKSGEAIYVMEQCFSGGMMDNLLGAQTYPCMNPKLCVTTAARWDEVSWACDTEGSYDEYVYHWTSAVYGKTPSGAVVNADTNGDGSVTVSEAHEYAKSHDSRSEHPQSGSCVTNACGATLKARLTVLSRPTD
jgi:hypothetical protein